MTNIRNILLKNNFSVAKLIGGTFSEKIVVYLLYNLRYLYLYINRDYGSDYTFNNLDGTISAAGIPAGRIDARIYSRNAIQ